MIGAHYQINQAANASPTGTQDVARVDVYQSQVIHLVGDSSSGQASPQWTILAWPAGATRSQPTNATTFDATFTAAIPGSYRVEFLVDDGEGANKTTFVFRVTRNSTGLIIDDGVSEPAFGETVGDDNAGSNDRGYAKNYEVALARIAPSIDNVTALRARVPYRQMRAHLLGHTVLGKGGGPIYWDATSTEASNGGTILTPTGLAMGRWKRPVVGEINPLDFGAIGDGVADDTAAINAAKAAAPLGGTLYFPRGAYRFTSTLTFGQINVRGDGIGSVLVPDVGTGNDGVRVGAFSGATTIGGVTWKNIAVLGQGNVGVGLHLKLLINSSFENVHVSGGGRSTGTAYEVLIEGLENCTGNIICSVNVIYPLAPPSGLQLSSDGLIRIGPPASGSPVAACDFYFNLEGGHCTALYVEDQGVGGNNTYSGVIQGQGIGSGRWGVDIQGSKGFTLDLHCEQNEGVRVSNDSTGKILGSFIAQTYTQDSGVVHVLGATTLYSLVVTGGELHLGPQVVTQYYLPASGTGKIFAQSPITVTSVANASIPTTPQQEHANLAVNPDFAHFAGALPEKWTKILGTETISHSGVYGADSHRNFADLCAVINTSANGGMYQDIPVAGDTDYPSLAGQWVTITIWTRKSLIGSGDPTMRILSVTGGTPAVLVEATTSSYTAFVPITATVYVDPATDYLRIYIFGSSAGSVFWVADLSITTGNESPRFVAPIGRHPSASTFYHCGLKLVVDIAAPASGTWSAGDFARSRVPSRTTALGWTWDGTDWLSWGPAYSAQALHFNQGDANGDVIAAVKNGDSDRIWLHHSQGGAHWRQGFGSSPYSWSWYYGGSSLTEATDLMMALTTEGRLTPKLQGSTSSNIADIPGGGAIGTAANTVDKYSFLTLTQTTAGQTLTLPDPTVTTPGLHQYISNEGSQAFTMLGASVAPGAALHAIWNGALWRKFS